MRTSSTALPAALASLNLDDNSLTALPVDIFDGLTGLETLDLSCNYFTTLDLDIFDPFAESLLYLYLRSDSFTTPLSETDIRAKFSNTLNLLTGEGTCDRVTASPTSLRVTEGGTGTYSVTLRSQPDAEVTVAVTSDNPDVTVSPTSLTFSTSNWGTAQPVTVSAAQDADRADESATLTLNPRNSTRYLGVTSSALAVIVTDTTVKPTPPVRPITPAITGGGGGGGGRGSSNSPPKFVEGVETTREVSEKRRGWNAHRQAVQGL